MPTGVDCFFFPLFDILCRAYCTRSQDATVISDDEERVIWIPGRLLVTASRDTEVYSFILDVVFRNGLFSAKLPVQAAAWQWAVVYMHSGEHDRNAIMGVLRAKARAQHDVQSFLTIRGKLQSINQSTTFRVDWADWGQPTINQKQRNQKQ